MIGGQNIELQGSNGENEEGLRSNEYHQEKKAWDLKTWEDHYRKSKTTEWSYPGSTPEEEEEDHLSS